MTLLFQQLISHHHQRMEFTFHNSYPILELFQYSDFQERAQLLTQNLLQQGYVASRLKSSHQKFYGRHHNVVDHYELAISQMTMALLHFKQMFTFLYLCQDYYRTCLYICVTRQVSYKKQEQLTLREHMSSSTIFWWGLCCSTFQFVWCDCTFCVPCSDVLYDFRIKTMFRSS